VLKEPLARLGELTGLQLRDREDQMRAGAQQNV